MRFFLMQRYHQVAVIEIAEKTGDIIDVAEVLSAQRIPLGAKHSDGSFDVLSLRKWWAGRGIPASRLTGYHHNTLTNWCHNGYIRYFEISGGYMIPKSCLLNFLLSPHILDSYRPSKKLVDLAKEFSRQGKSTKKPTAK